MNAPQPAAQVPAAKNVLSVLRYVASQGGPVGAAAIARDVELPRSTTYHLLAALVDDGFVVHLPEERKYALGVTAHELGTGYSRQAPLQRIARFPIAQLVARTRRTAHLAVMHGREVIYVIEERAKRQRELVTDAGVRLPAHLTASGRAMLASMSAAQLAALYPGPEAFPTRYENGVHSVEALNEILERIRERGFSWEQDEVTDGFSSLAVAVVDRSGYAVASVTLTVANRPALSPAAAARNAAEGVVPERTVQLEDLADQWLPDVKRCAAEISRRLRPSG
ncbi:MULTISPECIES: IclR family transcriptional regulator [unclassified Arthrobacter]|uniref:IclR family transcriptional regulator n=1 Tax=unclassified Arthrobacter TaxID=235627 RepID=UPI00159DE872|nr:MULTISPECIES: IclR family transcriptional regulator [unclassified Arthrobacter]MCQ9163193.1 IclR family transcriptional regulator [Arthrobacter sp. STN4]NVM98555.1 IclR family transcriptional regulator [Arthrobacter sp. SDTb3-6]